MFESKKSKEAKAESKPKAAKAKKPSNTAYADLDTAVRSEYLAGKTIHDIGVEYGIPMRVVTAILVEANHV